MSAESTNERFLRQVDFMHLPLGVYVLERDGRFKGANQGARAILRLPESGPIEASIGDFHADAARFWERAKAAEASEERGEGFGKEIVPLRVQGREVFVEDYLKPLRSEQTGEVVGYVGCMVDISEEHRSASRSEALQRQVEELTLDIGRILHANTSTLLMVNQTLAGVAAALDPGLGADAATAPPDSGRFEERVDEAAQQLARSLERLLHAGDPERRSEALPAQRWESLGSQLGLLRDYRQIIPVEEMRNPTLRTAAAAIVAACRDLAPGWLPREPVRETLRRAQDLQRLVCFLDVLTTRGTVVQMDYTLRALRDFITSEVRAGEGSRRLAVARLIQEALAQLAEFAKASNVEMVWRHRPSDLEVVGQERDLVRALANLLHNAIKYSWRRDRDKAPWVAIAVEEEESDVRIEFESWGVPITGEEIRQELIFQMGYRGKWSTDRGRLGTGIGLTDAQRVARVHGGGIEVESQPAQPRGLDPEDRDYYKQPFLTRVALRLPLAS